MGVHNRPPTPGLELHRAIACFSLFRSAEHEAHAEKSQMKTPLIFVGIALVLALSGWALFGKRDAQSRSRRADVSVSPRPRPARLEGTDPAISTEQAQAAPAIETTRTTIRPSIAARLARDHAASLASSVDRFRAKLQSSQVSGRQLTDPEGRFHPFLGLLDGTAGFSLLMDDGLRSPPGSWTVLTRVETMLNFRGVSEQDKVTITRNFLIAMDVSANAPLSSYGAPELYREFLDVREAINEVRQIGKILKPSLNNEQAKAIVHAIRGWATGQQRLYGLVSTRTLDDLNRAEIAAIDAALRQSVDNKRAAMQSILTPEQFTELYESHGYDSREYWVKRRN